MGWFRTQLVGTEEQITCKVKTPHIKRRSDGRWMGKWKFDGVTYEVLDARTPKDAIRHLSELAGVRYRYVPGTNVKILERKK